MDLPSGSFLYDPMDISAMSTITQKIDALLKAEGFTPVSSGYSGYFNADVYHLHYTGGNAENVSLTTNEPKKL